MSGSDQANAILGQVQNGGGPMTIPQMVSTLQGLSANQNTILQNVDLSRNLGAKAALAQSLKNNIDPQTGAVNMAGLTADAKTNPALAYALQTFLPTGQNTNVTAQQLLQAKYQTAQQRAETIANTAQTLADMGPDVTQDDVRKGLGSIVALHPNDPILQSDVTSFAAGMGNMQGPGLQKYIATAAGQAKDAAQQFATQVGSTQYLNNGPYAIQTQANPLGNVSPTGQVISMGMSPGEANSLVPIASPGGPGLPPAGTQMTVTKAQAAAMATNQAPGTLPPGTGIGMAPSPTAQTQNTPAQGQTTVQQGSQGMTVDAPALPPQNAGGASQSPLAGMGFQSGPTPNVAANATANAGTYQNTLQDLNTHIQAQTQALPLLQQATQTAMELRTNGSTSTRAALAEDLQRVTGGLIPEKDANAIAGGDLGKIQELQKILANQMTQQYGDIAGTKTADLYTTVMGSNPTVDKMPELFQGLQTIAENTLNYNKQEADFLNQNSGLQDPVASWAKYAQTVGLTPDNAASWAKENSPDAPMGGPALQSAAANGSPGANRILSAAMAHPNTPIAVTGSKNKYLWNSITQQMVVIPPEGQ